MTQALHEHAATVARTRKRFCDAGLEAALYDQPRPGAAPKLDAAGEAHLIALACSAPPEGRAVWSMQLLADRLVELQVVDAISDEAVRRTLEKNQLKPWQKEHWCTSAVGADFVSRMEDVLDLYVEAAAAPPDPLFPLVCFDERPVVLHEHAHPGTPCAPGRRAREDYEYVRRGTCVCLLSFAPAEGWRHVELSEHRAAGDFAHAMRRLCNETYPEAQCIRVVLDNLSTHSAAALYQTFAPAEARRLARKLEFHYTPKHASWLNMAEIELAVLSRQCLARRLGSRELVAREVATWEDVRNEAKARVHWRFTTADARVKLVRRYPSHA